VKVKYQSRQPLFPQRGYMVAAWITYDEREYTNLPFTLTRLFRSREEIFSYMAQYKSEAEEKYSGLIVLESVLVVSLKLDTLVPLKKMYWQAPSVEVDLINKAAAFLAFYDQPSFHKILVTPRGVYYENGQEEFLVAIPILESGLEKKLEAFMRTSKHPVDPTAKYAALYEPIKIESYNWKTGKKSPVKRGSETAN